MTESTAITLAPKPILYSIKESDIAELKNTQENIISQLPANIADLDVEIIKTEKRNVAKFRITTEKEREALKAGALEYGRMVDSLAKVKQIPIAEIETFYDNLISQYDAHFEQVKRETEEKEAQRVADLQGLIADLNDYKALSPDSTADHIDRNITALHVWSQEVAPTIDFAEFKDMAAQAFDNALAYLTNIHSAAVKREAAQAELDEQHAKQAEAQAKLDAERAEFEAKKKAEEDKIAVERKALQEEKDLAERLERQRQYDIKEAELTKQRQEREDRELKERQERELAEIKRLEEIKIENEARKAKQDKEDKIRNAAPQMLALLYDISGNGYVVSGSAADECDELLKTLN